MNSLLAERWSWTLGQVREARQFVRRIIHWWCATLVAFGAAGSEERTLRLAEIPDRLVCFQSEVGESGEFTWWFPAGAQEYVLPISAGVLVETSRADSMRWLQQGSPWSLLELPVLGLRYGNQLVIVIVPWPHYAELIVEEQLGIRFSLPQGRRRAAPPQNFSMRGAPDPLEVARAFRRWRSSAATTGAIPRPRPLTQKMADLEQVTRLLGAPHFYLWGPALFSKHDIPRDKWLAFAKTLQGAPPGSFGGRLVSCFEDDHRQALEELAKAEQPLNYLTVSVAAAIDAALSERILLMSGGDVPGAQVVQRNKQALAEVFAPFVNPAESWGDGPSQSLLEALHDAGIERALLLLSDLYGRSPLPELAARAEKLNYLLGPYDSYHSVHSPTAGPNDTWETAQFDRAAYERGRVINADGSGHGGFRGRGYHFSPQAAWPYVQRRVGGILERTPYSAWFMDCDATAECFDDFSPEHPATRVDDATWRRRRLHWLETECRMVVGSEGGSVLFSDVIHFGHGVHTPYIGHLDPAFRDRQSPHFLGRHWPPDTPEQAFKAVPVPESLKVPYFDPTARIPLYQAALGDEVITTHHWSFDSLKFKDVALTRELMEILYMVPPMYHLNRETWTKRRDRVLRHLSFWGPLHRELATAPLTRFACLTEDRLVQQTAFQSEKGEVMITVNFDVRSRMGCPSHSATVTGPIAIEERTYSADK